ncbi:DUF523 domain-containing protein [Actinomadura sp. NEAU-AAG7]|uniref:DUF523 domain-containing protein n=1 Tax=Actinomadura sp. NEAU-AAG7 TaxID=2839640 RepID=UPI001BE3FB88|nr:DUF523 domain-containing protein [Actinomadura sp. NEAU-AAG7]MBT2210943.1 DUF523 domain-containing protein [Actinomadura sp. NEAU-AAG7]
MERILVSSCLMGRPVRYDGRAKPMEAGLFGRWRAEGRLVPFCPEVAGGLPVPRPPAEIVGSGSVLDGTARIVTAAGENVTDAFLRGARLALDAARRAGARVALLKEGSPSCGSHRVYDGTFTGTPIPGAGVTTALLERSGIRVFSEDDLDALESFLISLESPRAHPDGPEPAPR